MELKVGIDPSLNSTGLTIILSDGNKILDEWFYIIKPNKLTKKESKAEDNCKYKFHYCIYEKYEAEDYGLNEVCKLSNFINISSIIYKLILQKWKNESASLANIKVCIEGLSYGSSTKTKSIFDLAGLNYIIRYAVLMLKKYTNMCDLIIMSPAEIKKISTNKGNASKAEMVEVFNKFHEGFELPKIDDISDSWNMANALFYK